MASALLFPFLPFVLPLSLGSIGRISSATVAGGSTFSSFPLWAVRARFVAESRVSAVRLGGIIKFIFRRLMYGLRNIDELTPSWCVAKKPSKKTKQNGKMKRREATGKRRRQRGRCGRSIDGRRIDRLAADEAGRRG